MTVNVVLVKKALGKCRICVNDTDLNKVCPKNSYLLPSKDKLVEKSVGYKLFSFMDAYSSYNQNPTYEPDRETTSFITEQANYRYNMIPFSLKINKLHIKGQ